MAKKNVQITAIGSENINFPTPKNTIDQDSAQLKRDALANNAVVITSNLDGNSSCFTGVKFEAIKATCGFDEDVAAQLFIANQNDNNIADGAIYTHALCEYIYEQAELNQGTIVGEQHLDTLDCLNAITDTTVLVTARLMNHQENKEQWPTFRKMVLGAHKSTDASLDLHHIVRQADSPEKTLDPTNVVPKERQNHKADHNKKRKESTDEMKKIKIENSEQIVGKKIIK